MSGMQQNGYSHEQSASIINQLINQQAFTMSATDIFYASAILFIILIGLVWIAKPSSNKARSEEHTSELQSLMRISYAVFCLKKKKTRHRSTTLNSNIHNH